MLILSLAIAGFTSCDNGSSPASPPPPPPPPATITDVIVTDPATGVHGVSFGSLNRSLRFFGDGRFDVWSSGLGPTLQLYVSGTWSQRYDDGHIIDVHARRNFTFGAAVVGFVGVPVTQGQLLYSFRYVLETSENLRVYEIIPGVVSPNNNRGIGQPYQPAPNLVTFKTGFYGRAPLLYFRPDDPD